VVAHCCDFVEKTRPEPVALKAFLSSLLNNQCWSRLLRVSQDKISLENHPNTCAPISCGLVVEQHWVEVKKAAMRRRITAHHSPFYLLHFSSYQNFDCTAERSTLDLTIPEHDAHSLFVVAVFWCRRKKIAFNRSLTPEFMNFCAPV
jgi:hypothetical protein